MISSSVASPTSVPVPVPAPVDAIVPTESTRYIPEPGSTSPRPATQPLAKVSKKMGPQTRGVNHTAQPRFKDGRGRDGRIQDSSTFGRRFEEAPSGEKYGQLIETGFLSPLSAPLSTFSTDVDTASSLPAVADPASWAKNPNCPARFRESAPLSRFPKVTPAGSAGLPWPSLA
ncbi:von Willebrand factor type A domain-containing protein, partial [bacterium]|nr:von Willebrand factor type A domain-containing protein [bacterium]